ncbi:MAG: hypothetical protein V9F82_07500 [Dermatophilaceae bacterium]
MAFISGHWAGAVLADAYGADFKFIAGKCKRRGAVAVGVVEFEVGQFGDQVDGAFHFLAVVEFLPLAI